MSKKKEKLRTLDRKMKKAKFKLDPVDKQVLESAKTGEGLVPITSVDQLKALAKRAGEVHDGFLEEAMGIMTRERAEFVRRLRVDEDYTWRAVARECSEAWDTNWGSNQLAGMALCDIAAKVFGEDYMEEPWN
jgi:hypothetical protein